MTEHQQQPAWHTETIEQVCLQLGTDHQHGLAAGEAAQRLDHYGPNEIPSAARRPLWHLLLAQFADFMILILIGAAVISGIVGEPLDAVVIVTIVALNALIGALQEYRSERAIAALKAMAAPQAKVLRGGKQYTTAARELVPGDIVRLEAGDVVPADMRLLETAGFKVDESALSGESVAAEKRTQPLPGAGLSLGDRHNMAYKGTLVTGGRATGVVVATGLATELGRIAALLQEQGAAQTPLQQRLTRFGRRLAWVVLAIAALIFAAGLARGEPLVLMFLTAVSLAVAAIPEALPAVVSISLALGARKMSRHRALIRRLPAVETLGSVTYICADKTGTLTRNRMRAEIIVVDNKRTEGFPTAEAKSAAWRRLGQALALNNDVHQDAHGAISGDPTEVALFEAAEAAGYERAILESELPRIAELPFDAERKCMTTMHRQPGGVVAFTKGAPEQLLPRCKRQAGVEGDFAPAAALEQTERLAGEGYRVLAFALREFAELPAELNPEDVECDLTLLGLVALIDPPREEARRSVEDCRSAGIVPVMITGDHPATARAIARRLGIAEADAQILTGRDLSELSAAELQSRAALIRVYARVSPEQKIRIVEALQSRGEFVAMTGDGVNDAPALRRADIGVAMGRKGTDVAREAADMVLLDDNFATIVAAVREGRRIFDNIRKFVKYTMTSNAGEIWTLFLAPFLGLPIPLLPIQILWINLVTDGLPGLALAVEPEEDDIMRRPPRPPAESIFAHGMWQHILWVGLLIGGLSILVQAWAYQGGSEHWQTMVFTTLTLCQLAHVLAIRSERDSLFKLGLTSNLPLLGAVVLTVILQLATIYVPFLNPIFKTQPLTIGELAVCLLLPIVVFIGVEIEKWLVRQGRLYAA